jgi:hypothetical protein
MTMRRLPVAPSLAIASSLVIASSLAGLLVACGNETIKPAPVDASTTTTSTGGSGGSEPEPPKGTPIRSVETRSPWGGVPGNLLVDGDFEFSVVIEGSQPQAGWFAFGNFGRANLRGETGGLCKSGLRCAVMSDDQALFGQGTSARDSAMIAGLWAKLPAGYDCNAIAYDILRCSSFFSVAAIPPVSEQPDADGWCEYRGMVNAQPSGACVFIENTLAEGDVALVDLATLLPVATAEKMQPGRKAQRGGKVPAARAARGRKIAEAVRRQRRFGAPSADAQDETQRGPRGPR